MSAEIIAAIQSARLDFQGLLARPFSFADSPSINATPAAPEGAPVALAVIRPPSAPSDVPAAWAAAMAAPVVDPEPAAPVAPAPDWHDDDGTYHEAPAAPAPVVPAGWRLISARFSSRCDACGGYITQGDSILYRKGQKARHEQCAPAAPAAAAAAPVVVDVPPVTGRDVVDGNGAVRAHALVCPVCQSQQLCPVLATAAREASDLIKAAAAAAAAPVAPPAPAAPKPAGRGKTAKASRKASGARRTAAPVRPLAPITWDPNAF
jgi:hypothetical protein